jgi:hypothetical protein
MGVELAFWNDVLRDALSCLGKILPCLRIYRIGRQPGMAGQKLSLIALKGHMNYFSDLSRADLL